MKRYSLGQWSRKHLLHGMGMDRFGRTWKTGGAEEIDTGNLTAYSYLAMSCTRRWHS